MAVMSLGHSKEDIVPKHTGKSKQLLSVSESQMIHSQNLFNEPARFFFLFVCFKATCAREGSELSLPFAEGQMLTCCEALRHQATPTTRVYIELYR